MKNKIKLVLVSVLSIVLLTGCGMKENIHMDIKANKDVNVSMTIAMDDELIDTMIGYGEDGSATKDTSKITDEQRWTYLDEGMKDSSDDLKDWEKVKYDKDGYKGYTYTSKTLKLDDLSTEKDGTKFDLFSSENLEEGKLFVKKGNTYKANFTGDMSKDESLGSTSSYSSSMDLFEITFSVTLPTKPTKQNATKVSEDGKTLTWDLTKNSDIQFEFNMGTNYLLYIGIAVLVIVVVVVVVVLSKSAGKKKEPVANVSQGESAPSDKPVAQPASEQSTTEQPVADQPVAEQPAEATQNHEANVETPSAEAVMEKPNVEANNEGSLQDMYNGAPAEAGNQAQSEVNQEAQAREGSLQDMYNENPQEQNNQNNNQ